MADTASKPLKQHRGNCHCGAYVYEVKLPDPIAASECNCSVCVRKGYVWVRLTPESDFKVVKGDDGVLTKYSKNNVFFHKFCTNCSTPLMASNDKEGSDNMTVLNIRAIQGPLDVWNMEKPVFDGSAIPPAWTPREYTGPEPAGGPKDGKLYHGSCHCGKVTIAARVNPLEKRNNEDEADRICECNCSVDQRTVPVDQGGFMWIYPNKDEVVLRGREHTSTYACGPRVFKRVSCKTCGVTLMNDLNELTDAEVAALPEGARQYRAAWIDRRPVNVRVFDNVDYDTLRGLKTVRFDGYHFIPPPYAEP